MASVKVENHATFGNVLVATRQFQPGEAVVHERPLLHVPQLKPSNPLYKPLQVGTRSELQTLKAALPQTGWPQSGWPQSAAHPATTGMYPCRIFFQGYLQAAAPTQLQHGGSGSSIDATMTPTIASMQPHFDPPSRLVHASWSPVPLLPPSTGVL